MRLLATVLVLASVPAAALAATDDYRTLKFSEPASRGLDVQPPLDEFRAVAGARIVVPVRWQRLALTRYMTTGSDQCRYRISFSVRSRVGDPGDAAEYVEEALPAASPSRLLDSGVRGSRAFRVVRDEGGTVIRIRALWTAVLTRRKDVAPEGKVVWSDVRATATSRRGDECHAGTWRSLGPLLGDALVVARTNLRFVKK